MSGQLQSLDNLPPEILRQILANLDQFDKTVAKSVSKYVYNVLRSLGPIQFIKYRSDSLDPITIDTQNLTSITFKNTQDINRLKLPHLKVLELTRVNFDRIDFDRLPDLKKLTLDGYHHPLIEVKSLRELTLGLHFDQPISGITGLRKLITGYIFNQSLDNLDMSLVRELHLGRSFDQPLDRLNLSKVRKLTIYNHWRLFKNVDLPSLTDLTYKITNFTALFEMNLNNLTHLRLDTIAQTSLNKLYLPNLDYLEIFNFFRHKLIGRKFPRLRILKLSPMYNYPLDGFDLHQLVMGQEFNQSVNHLVNLRELVIGRDFRQLLGYFPHLTHLTLHPQYTQDLDAKNFPSLKHLVVASWSDNMRRFISDLNLTHLTLKSFDRYVGMKPNMSTLTHLTLHGFHGLHSTLDYNLPKLTHLTLAEDYMYSVYFSRLPKLRFLKINQEHNRAFDDPASGNLEELLVGDDFDNSLAVLDLRKLRRLELGWSFNHPLVGLDMPNLTDLVIGPAYNHPIDSKLLASVKNLTIHEKYFKDIPKHVKYLNIYSDFPNRRRWEKFRN